MGRTVTVSKEQLDSMIKRRYSGGLAIKIEAVVADEQIRGIRDAARRYYGGWTNALAANDVEPAPRATPVKFFSSDDVMSSYKRDIESGIPRHKIRYRASIIKYFGSIENLDAMLGFERKEPEQPRIYEPEVLDERVFEVICNATVDYISAKYLNGIDRNIVRSIRHHYGSITDYFSRLDIDFYAKPYVPFRWTSVNIKRQLMRWISDNTPVNYTAVAQRSNGIIVASRKLYGGWAELFEACGLKYDDYRVDTDMASFYGHEFETIVGELLADIGVEFTKYNVEAPCHPDFVVGDHWYDAKLSQWTIHMSDNETVRKYEPHCEKLTIVFLRGDKTFDKMISTKTRVVNVMYFINQLDGEKQRYYMQKFDKIEHNVSETNELDSKKQRTEKAAQRLAHRLPNMPKSPYSPVTSSDRGPWTPDRRRGQFGNWMTKNDVKENWLSKETGIPISAINKLALDTHKRSPKTATLLKVESVLRTYFPDFNAADYWEIPKESVA